MRLSLELYESPPRFDAHLQYRGHAPADEALHRLEVKLRPDQPFAEVLAEPASPLDRDREVLLVWNEPEESAPSEAPGESAPAEDPGASETAAAAASVVELN